MAWGLGGGGGGQGAQARRGYEAMMGSIKLQGTMGRARSHRWWHGAAAS
jgi:hypothetical protein